MSATRRTTRLRRGVCMMGIRTCRRRLRQQASAVVEHTPATRPAYLLESIGIPEPDRARSGRDGPLVLLLLRLEELVNQIVSQVRAVHDDVGLVYREYRVSREVGLRGNHPVLENRDE